MEKIIARVKNLVDVINMGLSQYEPASDEAIDFITGRWYREHITVIKTLTFALESIDETKTYSILYDGNTVAVENI